MSEQEPNTENLLNIESEVEANPQIKLLIKSIAGIFLFLSVVTILLCIGLLIHGYSTNHIAYEESIFKILDINFGIQEFYSLCFKLIGYSLLVYIAFLPVITKQRSTVFRYILFIISTICLLFYFHKFLVLTDFNLDINEFLVEAIFIFTSLFSVLVDLLIKHKKLYDTSNLICIIILILCAIIN